MVTPQPNLNPEAMPWARDKDQRIEQLERDSARRAQGEGNSNQQQNAALNLLGASIVTLQGLVNDLTAQVAAAIASNSYTQSVIDSKIANPGNVTSSGIIRADAGIYSTDAYSFNITGTRVTGWHQSDGHIATASSSIESKTNLTPTIDLDPEVVLGIDTHYYQYKAEVDIANNPANPDYNPDHKVHTEIGMIAEELHAAGLWQFVVYDRDENGELILKSDGTPRPISIHYILWAMAVHVVTQYLWGLYKAQQVQIESLASRLTAAGIA